MTQQIGKQVGTDRTSEPCVGCGKQRAILGYWSIDLNCAVDTSESNCLPILASCSCEGRRDSVMASERTETRRRALYGERLAEGFRAMDRMEDNVQ